MAIRNIMTRGVGFSPGSVRFIVTRGFSLTEPQTFKLPSSEILISGGEVVSKIKGGRVIPTISGGFKVPTIGGC